MKKLLKKISKKSSTINIESLKTNNDSLNLACLLNILDGLIELHGVMVVFTTNYPDKLDEAFLRPGRIDFKQEFKRSTVETLKSIINTKFNLDSNPELNENFLFPYDKFHNYVLSPAEIQSICFKNDSIINCIDELIDEQNKNMDRIKLANK